MKYISLITLLLFCMTTPLAATEPVDEPLEKGSLDAGIEALKEEVLSPNRDLFILEVKFMIADDTGREQPQFDVRVWE